MVPFAALPQQRAIFEDKAVTFATFSSQSMVMEKPVIGFLKPLCPRHRTTNYKVSLLAFSFESKGQVVPRKVELFKEFGGTLTKTTGEIICV